MGDVRDMLGIRAKGGSASILPINIGQDRPEKDDGLGEFKKLKRGYREIKGLLTSNSLAPEIPTILNVGAAAAAGPAPPPKPAMPSAIMLRNKNKRAAHWKYIPIVSSARPKLKNADGSDRNDVNLMHWVGARVDDYRFAKWNKKVKILEYTDDEYNELLNSPNWSRQETDRLMDLAKRFDLRFIVMEDRYNFPPNPPFPQRSVEDLKERYYEIQKALTKKRAPAGTDLSSNPLFAQDFNVQYERERKQELDKLLNRDMSVNRRLADILFKQRDNEHRIKELKKITKDRKPTTRKREGRPTRSASSASSSASAAAAASAAVAPSPRAASSSTVIPKKKASQSGVSTPVGVAVKKSSSGTPSARASSLEAAGVSFDELLAQLPAGTVVPDIFPPRPPGVVLQSQRVLTAPNLQPRIAKNLEQELGTLGFKNLAQAVTVPTQRLADAWDKLRVDVITMINMQKLVAKTALERNDTQTKYNQWAIKNRSR